MVTESYQDYKGYTIRLRAVTNNGFWYSIIKYIDNTSSPNGKKTLYLRKQGFNYIEPEALLNKAKNYIDNFEDNLVKKYNSLVKSSINS